jgi:hypothetical protein
LNLAEKLFFVKIKSKQPEQELKKHAGAELCQTQEKQGIAKPALPVVVFHLL